MDINDNSPLDPQSAPTDDPPRRRRRWTGPVVGAVAGSVLAASIAVPVTWAASHQDSDSGSTATTSTIQAPPTQLPQAGSTVPDWSGGTTGGTTGGTGTDAAETDATTAQSAGVVLIDTTLTDGEAAGTGLVLDPDGLVLTNYHVVEGSTSVTVTVATDGTSYDAEVVGYDKTADVALLQLDGASGLTTVDVDDDQDPAVSDEVTAVGNAEGQGYLSASTGDVVALDQSITTATTASASGERLRGLIETDAYVVGGYSGGALLDDEGEVVGITTAASEGGPTQSYAVPIQDAMKVADQIEAGHDTAQVQVGPAAYLGIGVADTTSGLRVAQVQDGTPAASAGVAVGSTVVAVDGTEVGSLARLRSVLATDEPGDRVVLQWRGPNGGNHRATVTLASSPVA